MSEILSAQTLTEMVSYYRARAHEYDEWFYRRGRYDRGSEINARWFAEAEEVFAALDALGIEGEVLELACGTGIWTQRLLRTASSITAIDASLKCWRSTVSKWQVIGLFTCRLTSLPGIPRARTMRSASPFGSLMCRLSDSIRS